MLIYIYDLDICMPIYKYHDHKLFHAICKMNISRYFFSLYLLILKNDINAYRTHGSFPPCCVLYRDIWATSSSRNSKKPD